MYWLSSNNGAVFRCFLGFLFFRRFSGNNHLTSATRHSKIKRFMRGMKQLFCFSWCLWVSGSGSKKNRIKEVCNLVYIGTLNIGIKHWHRTLFWASRFIIESINNVNLNVSVFKSAFQNLPQRSHEFVLIYPVLDNFFQFLNWLPCHGDWIEGELSFLALHY